ncbi:acylphosphatase [Alkalicoccus saliphilus]|uniref:Acylphosphatase n=1 Tax=Alkalicoccus saliphilus TaxID=200989 RepID=A0A2T4U7F8_9BACI|nr:acylphosphatase [Alkalicoccus saliphilus]PTL39343.1 acylphosphatase [Alkalicoccus saliphilus]
MPRYDITVTGRVQGVGFRYFTQMEAKKRKLTGWVRNETDGNVRLEVQGNEDSLDSFIQSLKEAQYPAKVEDVIAVTVDTEEKEKKFSILH